MKRLFLFLATKLGLFAISLGLGMLSYLVVQELGADEKADRVDKGHARPTTQTSEMVLDAEPHLIAKTESPVDAVGDALGIFYILESDGDLVRVAPEVGGGTEATPYASLADARTETNLGFSGLALHPNFLLREEPGYGRFYIVVAEKSGSRSVDFIPEFGGGKEDHQDVLYEYTVEDPLLAEFRGTRRELMRFSQPGPDHNLRGLTFDPHGLLFLGVGDGAALKIGRNSPSRNASSLTSAYGKVLRIDPLGMNSFNGQYGIPDGNPFRLVSGAFPELWVFGLRAPQSLTYDPFLRGLCIAERAKAGHEEINLSLRGGEHYGWDIAEDAAKLSRSDRARLAEVVTAPVVSLDLQLGVVAQTTGSVVYRGENFPSLAGALLFASHDGQLLALRPGDTAGNSARLARIDLGRFGEQCFSALRSGPRGELLFLCEDGQVFEMRKSASLGNGSSRQRSLYCEVDSVVPEANL